MEREQKSILDLNGVVNISVAVVVENNNNLLLIQEDEVERKGLWGFPSGKVMTNETILQAAERECLEETGYDVQITGLISVYYYQTKGAKHGGNISGRDRITVRFNFGGKIKDEKKKPASATETKKVEWLTLDAISHLAQTKQLRNWMNTKLATEAMTKREFPVDIIFTK